MPTPKVVKWSPTHSLSGAFSFGSPLSIEYLLENLVPELALAVDGDPATAVPSAAAIGSGGGATPSATATRPTSRPPSMRSAAVFDSTVPSTTRPPAGERCRSAAGRGRGVHRRRRVDGWHLALAPTGVVIDGDTATITYDVLFGGTAAYEALTKTITRVDGAWIVSQAAFCEFLSSARVACP